MAYDGLTNIHIEQLRPFIEKYFPNGNAYPALISEAALDADLDGWKGCGNIEGIALDLEGNGTTDIFVRFEIGDTYALTGDDLDTLIQHPPYYSSAAQRAATCEHKNTLFHKTSFPFRGRLLPDTKGKITGIVAAVNDFTTSPVMQFLSYVPNVNSLLLYNSGNPQPTLMENLSHGAFWMVAKPQLGNRWYHLLEKKTCDFPPCGGGQWVQDEFFVGVNEHGKKIVAGHEEYSLNNYVKPLAEYLQMEAIFTDEYLAGGDLITSSTHAFLPLNGYSNPPELDIDPDAMFATMFLDSLEIVGVDRHFIPSAAHLDMLLTPLDEVKDGKPVVVVGEGVALWGWVPEEAQYLDRMSRDLENRGFYVARIPYLYTGENAGLFSEPVAYSYTNILIERYEENGRLIKNVYMPTYEEGDGLNVWRLKTVNEEAADVYRRFGYTVYPIRNMDRQGNAGGSLRCLIKVVDRE